MVTSRPVVGLTGAAMPTSAASDASSPAVVTKLLAVAKPRRDELWRLVAEQQGKACLQSGRFAEALKLAGEVGVALKREGDLARVGLSLPLPAGAHPDAVRAARALAGRDPTLVERLKKGDSTRRAIELFWELQAGEIETARSRVPRRMPTGESRDWWRAIGFLLDRDAEYAVYFGIDMPGSLGQWAKNVRNVRLGQVPESPQASYQSAIDKGDRCLAARLFRPEFVENPERGRISATMGFCREHRSAADRMSATIVDPFARALWRVRSGVVALGPGWEAVAAAAEAPKSGSKVLAAPLAWLRAAAAWRTIGNHTRANIAIQRAGPRVASFPSELSRASQGESDQGPTAEQIVDILGESGLAAAITALGPCADVMVALEVLLELGELIEFDPREIANELAKVPAFPDAALTAMLLANAHRVLPASVIGHVLVGVVPMDAPAVLAAWYKSAKPKDDLLLAVAVPAALTNPALMAGIGFFGDAAVVIQASKAIPSSGDRGDELRIALAEGVRDAGKQIPGDILDQLSSTPGPWSDYAYRLIHGKSRTPTCPADPRIAKLNGRDGFVFSPQAESVVRTGGRIRELFEALVDALDALDAVRHLKSVSHWAGTFAGGDGSEPGERRTISAAEKQKKRNARKAQKAARKAGRKK